MSEARWLRRSAKALALSACAALTGLIGARTLGPFNIHGWADPDSADPTRSAMERYRLGRDLSADAAAVPKVRFTPYEPGGRAIAKQTIAGARVLEPYEPARTREWKALRAEGVAHSLDEALDGRNAGWDVVVIDDPDEPRLAALEDEPDPPPRPVHRRVRVRPDPRDAKPVDEAPDSFDALLDP